MKVMDRAGASGYSLSGDDVPIILGMIARGDRKHDIAAWYGVNPGRIAEAQNGDHGGGAVARTDGLPPKGPPGIKGRRLRESVGHAVENYDGGKIDLEAVLSRLGDALAEYDTHEA